MKKNLILTIESINDDMDVIIDNAINNNEFYRGSAYGLCHALFINDLINEEQQNYIRSRIKEKKHVIIEELEKLA